MKWMRKLSYPQSVSNPNTTKVDQRVISDVYDKIKPSLDSLKAYDQGKKEINAPDLRTTLSNIRRA